MHILYYHDMTFLYRYHDSEFYIDISHTSLVCNYCCLGHCSCLPSCYKLGPREAAHQAVTSIGYLVITGEASVKLLSMSAKWVWSRRNFGCPHHHRRHDTASPAETSPLPGDTGSQLISSAQAPRCFTGSA